MEAYEFAMTIVNQDAADAFFNYLVVDCVVNGTPHDRAVEIQRHNLGYFAGYYDSETRERVERLFKCEHPVFGPIAVNGQPTPKTVFKLGMRWAAGNRQQWDGVNLE